MSMQKHFPSAWTKTSLKSKKTKNKQKKTYLQLLINPQLCDYMNPTCVRVKHSIFPLLPLFSWTLPSQRKDRREKVALGLSVSNFPLPLSPLPFLHSLPPLCAVYYFFSPSQSISSPLSPLHFFPAPLRLSLSLSVFLSLVSRWEIPVLNVWWHHLVQNAGKWARGHLFNLLIELFRVSTPSLPSPPQPPPSPLAVWFMAYWRGKREAHFHFAWVKALHYSRKYRLPWPCERILHCDSLRLMNLLIIFSYDWRSGQQLLYCDTAWMLHPLRCDSGKIAPKHTSKQLHEFNSYCQKANNSGGE